MAHLARTASRALRCPRVLSTQATRRSIKARTRLGLFALAAVGWPRVALAQGTAPAVSTSASPTGDPAAPAAAPAAPAVPAGSPAPTAPAAAPDAAPIEVTVHGKKPSADPLGGQDLRGRDTRSVPGTFGDPFQAVAALPGIAPMASGLPYFYVRGAPPADTGYFVDGVPVPTLFHIGPGASLSPRRSSITSTSSRARHRLATVDSSAGLSPGDDGAEPGRARRGERSALRRERVRRKPPRRVDERGRGRPLRVPEPLALALRPDAVAPLRRLHVSSDPFAHEVRSHLDLRPGRLRSRRRLDPEPGPHRLPVPSRRLSLRSTTGPPARSGWRRRSGTTARRATCPRGPPRRSNRRALAFASSCRSASESSPNCPRGPTPTRLITASPIRRSPPPRLPWGTRKSVARTPN